MKLISSENWISYHLNVICEGYDYPDDSYILAGSCGVNIYFCSRNVQ